MEVVKPKAAMLSNYEVLQLLKELQKETSQRKLQKNQNLATISYETIKYLENTPCQLQSEEIIQKFMAAMAPYKLTKAEKLQLLNHRPTSAVEIQLIIQESEERLTETEIENLLEIIQSVLPTNEEQEMQVE